MNDKYLLTAVYATVLASNGMPRHASELWARIPSETAESEELRKEVNEILREAAKYTNDLDALYLDAAMRECLR
jgi:uncharacterized coiled-coil DUF342 family protein